MLLLQFLQTHTQFTSSIALCCCCWFLFLIVQDTNRFERRNTQQIIIYVHNTQRNEDKRRERRRKMKNGCRCLSIDTVTVIVVIIHQQRKTVRGFTHNTNAIEITDERSVYLSWNSLCTYLSFAHSLCAFVDVCVWVNACLNTRNTTSILLQLQNHKSQEVEERNHLGWRMDLTR